jgi:TonB family protein
MMTLRVGMLATAVVGMSLSCFAQSGSGPASQQTYTLEPVTTGNVACPEAAVAGKTRARIEGMMLVTESGAAGNVMWFSADPALASVAEAALKKWSFNPVVKDGQAVPVIPSVAVDYTGCDAQHREVTPEIGTAKDFPERVRVSAAVSQALLLQKVAPAYPTSAKKLHVQGQVLVNFVIDKDGNVTDVQPKSGPPELVPAAIDAVRQWRFRPYLLLGRPVDVDSTAAINFTLSGM